MFEMLKAGGPVMVPIVLCSILALAVIAERAWTLRRDKIAPKHTVAQIFHLYKQKKLDPRAIEALRESSPLGRVLAAGLVNIHHSREVMKESIEEAGRHVVHDLERYLTVLGTVAAISPLLGLLGTVFGIIDIFSVITSQGSGTNPKILAGGISEALITTASGLIVGIPALVAHRVFRRKVDSLVIAMEQEAIKLVEVIHGQREFSAEDRA